VAKDRFETRLAKLIYKRNQDLDFAGIIVYGPRGCGKTSFSIKTLVDLFKNGFELSEEEAYEEALDHMLYDLPNVTERIQEELENEHPTPSLILDDCGVYLGGTQYWSRMKYHSLMKSLMDTIRMASSSLILTVPSPKTLVKYAQAFDDYYVKIVRRSGDYRRKAKIYRQKTLPSGKTLVNRHGTTNFTCHLPNWVYDRHKKKRKQQLGEITTEIQESIEEES